MLMGRDTTRDDPALRLERASAQLFAWFERHGGPPGDAVHLASAHLLRHAATDEASHAQSARAALHGLLAAELPLALSARAALGEVCLQANEVLGDRIFLDAAHSLCEAMVHAASAGEAEATCLSAVPGRMLPVHHANLQAAALLARVGLRVGERSFVELARRATAFALAHQRPDGSWLHGEVPPLRWVDRFHAGARVSSLLELTVCEMHPALPAALARALRHLVQLHFDAHDVPRAALRAEEPGECDLLAVAEAMTALARAASADPVAARAAALRAARLADWASLHLQAWSLWRDPPSVHGPGRLLEALARVQGLSAGLVQAREEAARQQAELAWARASRHPGRTLPPAPKSPGGTWAPVGQAGYTSSGRLQ